jgi:hypothetical protein
VEGKGGEVEDEHDDEDEGGEGRRRKEDRVRGGRKKVRVCSLHVSVSGAATCASSLKCVKCVDCLTVELVWLCCGHVGACCDKGYSPLSLSISWLALFGSRTNS